MSPTGPPTAASFPLSSHLGRTSCRRWMRKEGARLLQVQLPRPTVQPVLPTPTPRRASVEAASGCSVTEEIRFDLGSSEASPDDIGSMNPPKKRMTEGGPLATAGRHPLPPTPLGEGAGRRWGCGGFTCFTLYVVASLSQRKAAHFPGKRSRGKETELSGETQHRHAHRHFTCR